jgi:serine/threonine protein kinase
MTGEGWAALQPERIGRYRILERIGKGAMGVVYSARDEAMDRVVALKVMMTDLEGDPETRIRFYREAQAAGRLLHPNIITIFDMGEDEGRIFIVMELLRGVTLGDFLKRPTPAPLEQKVSMMIQVCEGLGAAHACGIFHRDVKPGNLFVQKDGTIKILDFGVARLATSTMTAAGFIIGTPDYMSPEQARGREIDQRSDIFSAGAVFYYMLAGRKPFAAADLPSVLRKVQLEDPPALPGCEVPTPLFRIIAKALAKDPAHRQQNMADLAADLAKFRRYYEGETRRIAATARDRYAAIEDLVNERTELSSWLGLSQKEEEPLAARRLREEHADFVDQGEDALLLVPFSRCRMVEIAAALDAEYRPLSQAVTRLREERDAVDAAERAVAAGHPEEAFARLARMPDSTQYSPRSSATRDRVQRAPIEREAEDERTTAFGNPTPPEVPPGWADNDGTVRMAPPPTAHVPLVVRLGNRLKAILGLGSQ